MVDSCSPHGLVQLGGCGRPRGGDVWAGNRQHRSRRLVPAIPERALAELHGATEVAVENADGLVHIPMVGFTESLNVSVSAAICISSLVNKIRGSIVDWRLSEEEKNEIRLTWVKAMVNRVDVLERNFLKGNV